MSDWPGIPTKITKRTNLERVQSRIIACVSWVAQQLADCHLDKDGADAYAKLIGEARKMLDAERAHRRARERIELDLARFKHQTEEMDELRAIRDRMEELELMAQEREVRSRQRLQQ